jgi:hypothetical protein
VVVAGGGYLVDGFGMILVPDYSWTVGTFAFVGEALLILALLWKAVTGFSAESGQVTGARRAEPVPVAS